MEARHWFVKQTHLIPLWSLPGTTQDFARVILTMPCWMREPNIGFRLTYTSVESSMQSYIFYARFYHKLLRDEGLLEGNEPFKRLLTQGMVLNDGAKMSKSLGNTVDPEEMIQNYGADTVRLFMMFTSPPEQSLEWSDTAINGSYRFLKKLWKLIKTHQDSIKDVSEISKNDGFNEDQNKLRRKTHQTISKVTDDIGRRYTFNTAIAAVMELVNEVSAFNVNDELIAK